MASKADNIWAHPLMVPLGAGSLSGIVADTVTHPICTIKARMMTLGAARAAAAGGAPSAAVEGASLYRGLYRGLGAVLVGAAPAQSLYFGGMLMVQDYVGEGKGAFVNFCAGIAAQMCGSLAWVPMEVVKEKMMIQGQMQTKTQYSGSFDLAKRVVAKEGIGGLYRGYVMQQLTYGPFNALGIMLYNEAKPYVPESMKDTTAGDLLASAAGYGAAAFVTNPFDVVKTRKQVQTSNPDVFKYNGSFDILKQTVQKEGALALFDGVAARVGWLTPRCALAMTSFEYLAGQIRLKAEAEGAESES